MGLAAWLLVLAAGASAAPGLLAPGPESAVSTGQAIGLAWEPSPSPEVRGYFLCWGTVSGQCTNRLDVGNVTNAFVSGLQAGADFYFTVIAYDATREAPPSNEVRYLAPPGNTLPALRAEVVRQDAPGAALRLSFHAVAWRTYKLQVTQNFDIWKTVLTTNSPVDGLIRFEAGMDAARRFYRLEQN